jgi:large subunit ribosomal protein L17
MRHRVAGRQLSRNTEHRKALRRNMIASLFEHETISTTIEKAKEVKPFAEKLITLAKAGTLAARRRAIAILGNRDIVKEEDGKFVKKGTVIGKLFSDIAPRYLNKPGGYARIIKLSKRRLGDNGQLVLLQLVGKEEGSKKSPKAASKKKALKQTAQTKVQQSAEADEDKAAGEDEVKAGKDAEKK